MKKKSKFILRLKLTFMYVSWLVVADRKKKFSMVVRSMMHNKHTVGTSVHAMVDGHLVTHRKCVHWGCTMVFPFEPLYGSKEYHLIEIQHGIYKSSLFENHPLRYLAKAQILFSLSCLTRDGYMCTDNFTRVKKLDLNNFPNYHQMLGL